MSDGWRLFWVWITALFGAVTLTEWVMVTAIVLTIAQLVVIVRKEIRATRRWEMENSYYQDDDTDRVQL